MERVTPRASNPKTSKFILVQRSIALRFCCRGHGASSLPAAYQGAAAVLARQ